MNRNLEEGERSLQLYRENVKREFARGDSMSMEDGGVVERNEIHNCGEKKMKKVTCKRVRGHYDFIAIM